MLNVVALSTLFILASAQRGPAATGPQAMLDELLAADRAFAAAAAAKDVVAGLTPMFAPDVIIPGAPAQLYRGIDAVTTFLRASPDATARAEWAPVRGGLSADGQHGFTFGYMTLRRQDGSTVSLKYMSYWVKGPVGWRVAGYKRGRMPEGAALTALSTAMMPPAVPDSLVPARTDGAWLTSMRASLVLAEQAFSDEAQVIGLGPAFAKWGAASAVNMGGAASASYLVGPAVIARAVDDGPAGSPSPVVWSTETALVASSGDLGISFGFIRQKGAPAAGASQPGTPFFTIWSRSGPDAEWRYIAE